MTTNTTQAEIAWMIWEWVPKRKEWDIIIHMTTGQRRKETLLVKLDGLASRETLTPLIGRTLEERGYIVRYGVLQDAGIQRDMVRFGQTCDEVQEELDACKENTNDQN